MNDIIGWYWIEDQGDGSAGLRIFKTKEEAVKSMQQTEEKYGPEYILSDWTVWPLILENINGTNQNS